MSSSLNGTGVTFSNSSTQAVSAKVIQVVSSTLTTSGSISPAGSYIDIGLNATITPQFTTSKILIIVDAFLSTTNSAGIKLQRNGSDINNGTSSATNQLSFGQIGIGTSTAVSVAHSFLDSPASTSSLTYKALAFSDTGTIYYNRRSDTFIGATSTITLMEVAGT
jgi:hypothetical protein